MTMKSEIEQVIACDSKLTDAQLASIVTTMCDQWYREARGVSMHGIDGAPDWYAFETHIWQFGESIRKCLIKRKAWRDWPHLRSAIERVVTERRYAKGRQTFVLLLGHFAGADAREPLMRQLDDIDVQAQVLMSLRVAKVPDALPLARMLVETGRGAVRAEAKKYIRQFSRSEA